MQIDDDTGYTNDTEAEDAIFEKLTGGKGNDDDSHDDDDDTVDDEGTDEGPNGEAGGDPDPEDEDEDATGDDDESDDDAEDPQAASGDEVDYEYNGKTYKVPKPVLEGITHKTDELHKMQKHVIARANQVKLDNELFEGLAPFVVQMQNVDSQIEGLKAKRPDPATDPIGYMTFGKQVEELQDARQRLSAQLNAARTELLGKREAAKAELVTTGKAIIAKHIPKWNGQVAVDVAQHMRSLGYGPAELEELNDPRAVIMAYESLQFRQMKAGLGKAKEKRVAAPPPVVRTKGQNRTVNPRESAYQEAKARAKKTGNTRDVENALLAALTRPKVKKRG